MRDSMIDEIEFDIDTFRANLSKYSEKAFSVLPELKKPKILDMTIRTTEYHRLVRITKQDAISLARQNPVVGTFWAKHPKTKAVASFNKRYNVWIVEFLEDSRQIAFVSVSPDGRVLEIETK